MSNRDIRPLGYESVGQGIEDRGQNAARKADGEQTDVGEHVGEDARQVVVGIPQTESQIDKGILARRIEEEHQHDAHGHRGVEGR